MSRRSPRVSVSVVVCTFNGEDHLLSQLESIVEQSLQANELLISDDGSTDATESIVLAFVRADRGLDVQLLKPTKRMGASKNFEFAASEAQGDLVILADQDDLWAPDRIARVVDWFARDPGALMVANDPGLIDEEGAALGQTLLTRMGVAPSAFGESSVIDTVLRKSVLPGMSMAFKRELLEMSGPVPDGWMHDHWWAINAAVRGGLRVDPVPSVLYRQHSRNLIGAPRVGFLSLVRRAFAAPRRTAGTAAGYLQLMESLSDSSVGATQVADQVRAKALFESSRERLPVSRVLRCFAVWGAREGYERFASRGRLNMIRDILHHPRPAANLGKE